MGFRGKPALGLRGWQNKAKTPAPAYLALNPNVAVVGFDDALSNGQAQTGSASFAAAAFFATEKLIKDVGQIFGDNTFAGIGYLHLDAFWGNFSGQGD